MAMQKFKQDSMDSVEIQRGAVTSVAVINRRSFARCIGIPSPRAESVKVRDANHSFVRQDGLPTAHKSPWCLNLRPQPLSGPMCALA